jgi:choline dehydrogenase-like flavoprotein
VAAATVGGLGACRRDDSGGGDTAAAAGSELDERGGVVDRDNRVFGVDNLYVSGACTFPTSGTANPTLTVVALTLRLADHLVARVPRAHG